MLHAAHKSLFNYKMIMTQIMDSDWRYIANHHSKKFREVDRAIIISIC